MKDNKNQKYIAWGLTALAVVASSLLFSFLINRSDSVKNIFSGLTAILMPVIWGFLMTFLMTPMYNKIYTGMRKFTHKKMHDKTSRNLACFVATFLSIAVLLAVVVGLFAMLIPQLIESVKSMFSAIPQGLKAISDYLKQLFADQPAMEDQVMKQYEKLTVFLENWASGELLPNMNSFLGNVSSGVMRFFTVIKDFLLGIIVMAYVLNIKGTLAAQSKKILYSILPLRKSNDFIEECRYVKDVFSNYIIGKIIDSILVGLSCFVVMSIMRLPFPLLISVFVGVTDMIPFFGPFIGAIPSAFIILMVSPIQCLWFVIMIIILQQVDGNLLGPKIVGQVTGLSSFWVLFSILFFGGIWGIVGMIIGIPTFAVIYRLVGRHVNSKLLKRHLSFQTDDYWNLNRIDEENLTYIKNTVGENGIDDRNTNISENERRK